MIIGLALNLLTIMFLIINIGINSNLKINTGNLEGNRWKKIEDILFEHIGKVEAVHRYLGEIESRLDVFDNRLSFAYRKWVLSDIMLLTIQGVI